MHTTTQLARDAMNAHGSEESQKQAALFRHVMVRIHRYFRRVIFNMDDADDCLQQTLLLLQDSLKNDKYDPEQSFNTWLWLKARTVYAQHCRRHANRRSMPHEEVAAMPQRPSNAPSVARRVDAQAILERLKEKISEEAFEIFVLYYEGDLTHQEICGIVGRDRKTVRKRIAEAHRAIERIMNDRGSAIRGQSATRTE